MPRPIVAIPVLLLVAALSLAAIACNGDDDEVPAPTATASEAEPTTTDSPEPTVDATTEPPFEGGREPVEGDPLDDAGIARLIDVRAASHEGFDRIVFEFEDSRPGYRVEYVDEAIECGSGNVATVEGAALLQVRMEPAQPHDENFTPTFDPAQLTPGLPSIIEAVRTCAFEADLTWVVGLTEEADFAVTTLEDGFRVVVDVGHPE